MNKNRKIIYADELLVAIRDDYSINSAAFAAIVRHINAASAVQIKPIPETIKINDATIAALDRIGANAHGCGEGVKL